MVSATNTKVLLVSEIYHILSDIGHVYQRLNHFFVNNINTFL